METVPYAPPVGKPGAAAPVGRPAGPDQEKLTARLADLLGLPPSGLEPCPRGPTELCRNVKDPTVFRVARRACGCWHCPLCSLRSKRFRAIHFGRCLVNRDRPLYVGPFDGCWGRYAKAITRENKKARCPADRVSYVRVRPDPESLRGVLITTLPRRKELALVPIEEALGVLGQVVLGISLAAGPLEDDEGDDRRYRPINQSDDWAGPKRKPSPWEKIRELTIPTMQTARSVLAQDGINPESVGGLRADDPCSPVWSLNFRAPNWNPAEAAIWRASKDPG